MIQGSVQITMTNIQALRTTESPLTKRHTLNIESTLVAPMTASSGFRVLSEFSTASDCFVGEHSIEITPRNIKNVFSKITFDHVLNIEFFTANDSKFFCQGMCEFVQEIPSLVSDFQVLPCKLESGFLSVPTSFDSLTMNSLQSSQSLLSMEIESWVSDTFSFVACQECFQSDINPNNFLVSVLDDRSFNFTREHSEPLVCFVSFDCHGLDWKSVV